ncbi:MAG: hypothetical protein MJZ57_07760, partial [Bacteroidales bacterium]|nr:hypothetical protein [Bacteroidales bacterium]
TKFRVRNQSMIEANEVAGNIAALIKDDVAQMGAKSSLEGFKDAEDGTSDTFSDVFDDVYMDPANSSDSKKDSSSFILKTNDFKFRRVHYGTNGEYQSIEEVRWFLEGKTLKRSCWTVAKQTGVTLDASCEETEADEAVVVEMADGVENFSLIAGKPKVDEDDVQMFPFTGSNFMLVPRFGETHFNYMTVQNEGSSSILSGFAMNFDKTNNEESDAFENPENSEVNQVYAFSGTLSDIKIEPSTWKNYCKVEGNSFDFEPNMVYEISFELSPPATGNKMEMFCPGRDHLSVGFRDSKGDAIEGLEDFLFYPPVDKATLAPKRTMRFSVSNAIHGACMEFSFASYSPVVSEGIITIQNLKLKKLATASYDFTTWNTESATSIVEKKNVKAFKLSLSIKRNGEEGLSEEIIGVPSNGPKD